MIILILFAFLAGIATIAAPCILPILPIVLSAGATGGKRRPFGIVSGLIVSFSAATLLLSYLVGRFGISPDILRYVAIALLIGFGLVLIIPALLERFELLVSRFVPQGSRQSNDGYWSGVLVGVNLGLIWTPCTGPIMASVIVLAATQHVTITTVLITLAFAIGAAIPLLLVMYGSRRLIERFKHISLGTVNLQMVFGVLMIMTAIAISTRYDQRLQVRLLDTFPGLSSVVQVDGTARVKAELDKLKPKPPNSKSESPVSEQNTHTGMPSNLPMLGKAPDFSGITKWLLSDPLTIDGLKGKVVLVDFWTYTCINCIRTLPHVTHWYDTYNNQGLVVVGVHSPEFEVEKKTENVLQAMKQYNIHYPVAQDNNFITWNAYQNQYWPAEYLIDKEGYVRATHFGEGNYDETEANIVALLQEMNSSITKKDDAVPDQTPSSRNISPETYLGLSRRANFVANRDISKLSTNQWTISGVWHTNDQYIQSSSSDASITYHFQSNKVYLVLDPGQATKHASLLLDGRPIGGSGGADVDNGRLVIDKARLYELVNLGGTVSNHVLEIKFDEPGVAAFAFTFG